MRYRLVYPAPGARPAGTSHGSGSERLPSGPHWAWHRQAGRFGALGPALVPPSQRWQITLDRACGLAIPNRQGFSSQRHSSLASRPWRFGPSPARWCSCCRSECPGLRGRRPVEQEASLRRPILDGSHVEAWHFLFEAAASALAWSTRHAFIRASRFTMGPASSSFRRTS